LSIEGFDTMNDEMWAKKFELTMEACWLGFIDQVS